MREGHDECLCANIWLWCCANDPGDNVAKHERSPGTREGDCVMPHCRLLQSKCCQTGGHKTPHECMHRHSIHAALYTRLCTLQAELALESLGDNFSAGLCATFEQRSSFTDSIKHQLHHVSASRSLGESPSRMHDGSNSQNDKTQRDSGVKRGQHQTDRHLHSSKHRLGLINWNFCTAANDTC